MHPKTIITPRYWLAKLNVHLFQKRYPEAPWLTEAAIYFLDRWLKPTDRGIEWGSGRSTIWFASRTSHLVSIENNKEWYKSTFTLLHKNKITDKVSLMYLPIENDLPTISHPYSDIANDQQENSLDYALIDGRLRVMCMERIISKLKPGGLLILDNADIYIPNNIMGRHSTVLTPCTAPPDERWKAILDQLHTWREIFTTNGVWDTVLWVKPF